MKGKLIKTDKGYILEGDNLPNPRRLSLKNCQAIENGYDLDELEELAQKDIHNLKPINPHPASFFAGYRRGFQKALEILGDKKFSEEDILDAWEDGATKQHPLTREKKEKLFKALQQKEWKVEVIMDRIPADLAPGGWDVFPKLDANNCLILKRVE